MELVLEKNETALIMLLWGAHNDLAPWKSITNIQSPRAKRTYRAFRQEVRKIMFQYRKWLAQTKNDLSRLEGQARITSDTLEGLASVYERFSTYFGTRIETEVEDVSHLHELFGKAGRSLRAGNQQDAVQWLRRAREWQIALYSTHFVLPRKGLDALLEFRDPTTQSRVIHRQVALLKDNLHYWVQGREAEWVIP